MIKYGPLFRTEDWIRICEDPPAFNLFLLTPDPPAGGALAEGFHERLREFHRFERTFEVGNHKKTNIFLKFLIS